MKKFYFVVFFAISCAVVGLSQAPNDKRVPKHHGAASAKNTGNTAGAQKQAANKTEGAPAPAQGHGKQENTPTEESSAKKQPGDDVAIQRQLAKFTKYLVYVGALQLFALIMQAIVFFWTLLAIRRQAKIMEGHSEHLGNLVTAAEGNAAAATKNAEFSKLNAEATEVSANAARDNAAAARASVEAMINSERPWVLVENLQLSELLPMEMQVPVQVTYEIQNYGRTPARVVRSRTILQMSNQDAGPPSPEIYDIGGQILQRIVPQMLTPRLINVERLGPNPFLSTEQIQSVNSRDILLWAYGFVAYRDVLGSDLEYVTRFCYCYIVPPLMDPGRFCLAGPEEYNRCT